jgi:hypothetical protein
MVRSSKSFGFAALWVCVSGCGSAQPGPIAASASAPSAQPSSTPGPAASAPPATPPPAGANPIAVVGDAITDGCSTKGDHCFKCHGVDALPGNFECASAQDPKTFTCVVVNFPADTGRGSDMHCFVVADRAVATPCAKFGDAINGFRDATRRARVECYDSTKQFYVEQKFAYAGLAEDPAKIRDAVGQFMDLAATDLQQLSLAHALKN